MKIGAKDYAFNAPTLGLLRKVAKIDQPIDWEKALSDDAEFEKARAQWKLMCALIFESPDEGLDLELLTVQQWGEIRNGFFSGVAKDQPKS